MEKGQKGLKGSNIISKPLSILSLHQIWLLPLPRKAASVGVPGVNAGAGIGSISLGAHMRKFDTRRV